MSSFYSKEIQNKASETKTMKLYLRWKSGLITDEDLDLDNSEIEYFENLYEDLYSEEPRPRDVIHFYARSPDTLPGMGPGDSVIDSFLYIPNLVFIPHWRKMFSPYWDGEIIHFENLTYRSFEHAIQATRIKSAGYTKVAYSFCLESNSELSKNTGSCARKTGKKFPSADEWNEMADVKEALYMAKFRGTTAGKALLATGDAELWNSNPRINSTRCLFLEKIRNILRTTPKTE